MAFPMARHQVSLSQILEAMNAVVRQYTGKTVRAVLPLEVLIAHTLVALARPGRRTMITRSPQHGLRLIEIHPDRELQPEEVCLACATCSSMHQQGEYLMQEELRLHLSIPSVEAPDEGPYADDALQLAGQLYAY